MLVWAAPSTPMLQTKSGMKAAAAMMLLGLVLVSAFRGTTAVTAGGCCDIANVEEINNETYYYSGYGPPSSPLSPSSLELSGLSAAC